MSRIKGKDTGPERELAKALAGHRLTWEAHARDLPGRPDFVFREAMVAVFVEGDFWHGWHFEKWRDKLSEAWEDKISSNRARDARNHRKLRRQGWKVIRAWEHQLKSDLPQVVARILTALAARSGEGNMA